MECEIPCCLLRCQLPALRKHSLLPSICEVLAVGIGASNKEFRTPYFFTSSFSTSHSHRSPGVTSHISYWKIPWLTGEPSYVSYGPSCFARSLLAVMAA